MHPRVPALYGQIKTQKTGYPIRPVIDSYTHPAFLLSRLLSNWLKTVADYVSTHSIKNSSTFAWYLQDKKFPLSFTLVSFDIVNKYSNISVMCAINVMCDILSKNRSRL